jgi:hypothetical protein
MNVLIVTSALSFVPDNYHGFLEGVLAHSNVRGLVECRNRDWSYAAKALALVVTGAAPRFGLQILRNFFGSSTARRRALCQERGLRFLEVDNPNGSETRALIAELGIDLLINARTRYFFKKDLLRAPRLGCVNIHHGLLPEQRGLMCDFWSHLEDLPVGFSIHVMTPKLDDGPILRAVPVETDRKNYLRTLADGARLEARVCAELIDEVARTGRLAGLENRSNRATYRRNPGLMDFFRLRLKGVTL